MMEINCIKQLKKKIYYLEREKRQVLEHLEILNNKLNTLNNSIQIIQEKEQLEDHNTKHFTYKTYKHKFNCRITKTVLFFLKQEPNRYFKVSEITRLVLDYGNQQHIEVTDKYCLSIRQSLKTLLNKGLVERRTNPFNSIDVEWKFLEQH